MTRRERRSLTAAQRAMNKKHGLPAEFWHGALFTVCVILIFVGCGLVVRGCMT